MDQKKRCTRCKTTKTIDCFNSDKSRRGGLFPWCSECSNRGAINRARINPEIARERTRKWREKNREKDIAGSKRWRLANPDKDKENRLQYSFGISLDQYKKMSLRQDNRCAICGQAEDRFSHCNSKKLKYLAVDHCHETKKIRGLLCAKCNHGLGNFKDSVLLLGRAMEYLSGQKDWAKP